MKKTTSFLASILLLVAFSSCKKTETLQETEASKVKSDIAVTESLGGSSLNVGLGGNAYTAGTGGLINDSGLHNWSSTSTITSVWFRLGLTGSLTVAVKGTVPSGSSNIKVTINGTVFNKTITGTNATTTIGTVNIAAAGYVRVDIQGVSKTGSYFGDISDLVISGPTVASGVQYANTVADYYWSRRGPSCHLGYTVPSGTEWFYSELTVPSGQDKVGSYFMADGFDGGYFGMQVNSATERRVLFSVWDPSTGYTTLVRKGSDITSNGFGGEGTGGQSYLLFNWVAGTTYKFLLQGKPDGAGGSDYTAWFYAPENGAWKVIAQWKRPNTTAYLTGMYSFVENFNPDQGYLQRSCNYGNQWYKTSSGSWTEVTGARFTYDATASAEQRMDYQGGVTGNSFYLKNGGFFANYTAYGTTLTRTATGTAPSVNLTTLP